MKPRSRARSEVFALDEGMTPTTVLRLKSIDVDRIEAELRARIAATPQRFLYAPIVIDVADVDAAELPLHDLAHRLRACKLVPVGAANLPSWAVWNAAAAGMANVEVAQPVAQPPSLAVVAEPPEPQPQPQSQAKPQPQAVEPVVSPPPVVSTVTVRQPVRSGQVLYARGADLVVVAPVNPGAQVIADGHVHIYGALRGRAVAGAGGKSDAIVFCHSLEAELVTVAGHHLVAEDIAPELRGRPVQIWLEGDKLRAERMRINA